MLTEKQISKYNKVVDLIGLKQIAYLLFLSYALAFFALYHWFFDVFSNFMPQYMIGGLFLAVPLFVLKRFALALSCFAIAVLSFAEMRLCIDDPLQFFPLKQETGTSITVVQYNQHVWNNNFDSMRAWLSNNHEKVDFIVFQEASQGTSDFAKTVQDLYPYQIHEPKSYAFGMIVLSKYPFEQQRKILIKGPVFENFFLNVKVLFPELSDPISIYALHTLPPLGADEFEQRNKGLTEVSHYIREDKANYKILMGDFNLTPFSPFFAKLKKESELQEQSYGIFLNPTWPSANLLPFLKIPIDHTLYSKTFRIQDKRVGPSFGSDHNMLITILVPKEG